MNGESTTRDVLVSACVTIEENYTPVVKVIGLDY